MDPRLLWETIDVDAVFYYHLFRLAGGGDIWPMNWKRSSTATMWPFKTGWRQAVTFS